MCEAFNPRQVAFSWIAAKKPHLLLLDEPTNHLDLETIDSLARAINEFDGGCVLVSHDFRLIQQVRRCASRALISNLCWADLCCCCCAQPRHALIT